MDIKIYWTGKICSAKKTVRPTTQTVKFKNKEYTIKVTPAEDLKEAKFTLIRQAQH
jgi:hypothetical protein